METNNPNANPTLHRIHRIVANTDWLNEEFRTRDNLVSPLDLAVIVKVDELLSALRENARLRAELHEAI